MGDHVGIPDVVLLASCARAIFLAVENLVFAVPSMHSETRKKWGSNPSHPNNWHGVLLKPSMLLESLPTVLQISNPNASAAEPLGDGSSFYASKSEFERLVATGAAIRACLAMGETLWDPIGATELPKQGRLTSKDGG